MKGARTPAPVVITDPRRAEGALSDAYGAANFAEEARDQVHGILSALKHALDNDKMKDPRPFIDAAFLLLKSPLSVIETGTIEVRTSLEDFNALLSQPLDFIDEPEGFDVKLAQPRW